MQLDELHHGIEQASERCSEIMNAARRSGHDELLDKLEDLLSAQDAKTAAEIDSAACGRTFADRLRLAKAENKLQNVYRDFLILLVPYLKSVSK
jgi:predicted negative regulator of RcsB-dependent stress response